MYKLASDAVLRIAIYYREPIEITNLGIRSPGGVTYRIHAKSAKYVFDKDRTEARFSGLSVDGLDEDGSVTYLTDLLKQAMDPSSGTDLMADCRVDGTNAMLPNTVVDRVVLERRGVPLLDSEDLPRPAGGYVTHPITSHMQVNPLERGEVAFRLGIVVESALREYESGAYPDWSRHEFVAEYLLRHGGWADINFDEETAVATNEWAAPEDK